MPARTANEAFTAYVKPLRSALSCITREVPFRRKITNSEDADGCLLQELFFLNNPVRLKGAPVAFSFSQYFRIIRVAGEYRVRTEAYTYEIEDCQSRHELFAFHWEPSAPNSRITIPHLHVGFAHRDESLRIDNKAHIPTGHVSLEDVVSFLISELRVLAIESNWESKLREPLRVGE